MGIQSKPNFFGENQSIMQIPPDLSLCVQKSGVGRRHSCPTVDVPLWIADAVKALSGSKKTPLAIERHLVDSAIKHAAIQDMPTDLRQEMVLDVFKAILNCSQKT